jgi:hypothetical protein
LFDCACAIRRPRKAQTSQRVCRLCSQSLSLGWWTYRASLTTWHTWKQDRVSSSRWFLY